MEHSQKCSIGVLVVGAGSGNPVALAEEDPVSSAAAEEGKVGVAAVGWGRASSSVVVLVSVSVIADDGSVLIRLELAFSEKDLYFVQDIVHDLVATITRGHSQGLMNGTRL